MQNATICCAISAVTDPYSSMDMKNGNTHTHKQNTNDHETTAKESERKNVINSGH